MEMRNEPVPSGIYTETWPQLCWSSRVVPLPGTSFGDTVAVRQSRLGAPLTKNPMSTQ